MVSWARLGDLNIYSDPDDASPVDYEIVERVIHPDYNPTYVYNDIALFRLGEEVKFSAYVRPVCLNTAQTFRFNKATAIGWGRTSTSKYYLILNYTSFYQHSGLRFQIFF